jgi:hypothetical protein
LLAPVVDVQGTNNLDVRGGSAGGTTQGGHGRVRVDASNLTQFSSSSVFPGSALSSGSYLNAFATNPIELRITDVGPFPVDEMLGSDIVFDFGDPATQNIRIQGTNVSGTLPLRIVLTPVTGPPSTFDFVWDTSINPMNFPVTFVQNVKTQVHAWTCDNNPCP